VSSYLSLPREGVAPAELAHGSLRAVVLSRLPALGCNAAFAGCGEGHNNKEFGP